MAGDEEVDAVEDIETVDAGDENAGEGDDVEGFSFNIGSFGSIFRPVVKPGGGGGPKTPEGGGSGPSLPGGGTSKPSAPFDPDTVHF